MQKKTAFFYGMLAIFAIAVVIIVITTSEPVNEQSETEVKPEDTLASDNPHGENPHTQRNPHTMMQGGTTEPSKENVSQNAKQMLEKLEQVVKENPEDTATVRTYAEMLAAGHQPERAIELFESILDRDPERIDILMSLTAVTYRNSNFTDAIGYTNRILEIDPENADAYYNLGAIQATMGEKDKAIEIWNKVISDYPNSDAANKAKESIERLRNS